MVMIPAMPAMQPVGYLSNFNFQQGMQEEGQIGLLEQQLQQVQQQQSMMGMQLQRDEYGQMNFPQMGMLSPMAGMVPMGGINPMSQMAGVSPPNEVMQSGGVQKGLKDVSGTGSPAWPTGTQQTAGGYFIVPGTGDNGFKVLKPGSAGNSPDDVLFNCNGDPHVFDKNGNQVFMFTKNCDFQLPDGTTLTADTSATTGVSYMSKMGIINGNSHVDMTWSNNNGVVGPDQNNGVQALADRYKSTNWTQDTYKLAVDSAGNPSFYDFVRGQDEGKVTGDSVVDGAYTPTVDHNQVNYAVAKQFEPQIGSPGYGDELFNNSLQQLLNDPKYKDALPPGELDQITANWEQDLAQTENGGAGGAQRPMPFPGYAGAPWGGGVGPAQMPYLQQMYNTTSQYAPLQPGMYGNQFI